MYREIKVELSDSRVQIIPAQSKWVLNPLIYRRLDKISCHYEDVDQLSGRLVEKASKLEKEIGEPLGNCIIKGLASLVPELKEYVTKTISPGRNQIPPSPWILFSPATQYSALTRYLIRDYERLDDLLSNNGSSIGGLSVLDGASTGNEVSQPKLLPLIQLNESQQNATADILSEKPISVICGPPGCGKSQVVVASILNAWASGKSVLFTSNNNKAVDVVKERLEQYENEFPIAVRAGSRTRNNVTNILNKTIRMKSKSSESHAPTTTDSDQRHELQQQKQDLQKSLDSGIPQRIDEARLTALKAYSKYKQKEKDMSDLDQKLEREKNALGLGHLSIEIVIESQNETLEWIDKIEKYIHQLTTDNRARRKKQGKLTELQTQRRNAGEEIGLSEQFAEDWEWLSMEPSPEMLENWLSRITKIIPRKLGKEVTEIEKAREAYKIAETQIKNIGLPIDIEVPTEDLIEWTREYIQYTTIERTKFDIFPWSQIRKHRKQLASLEKRINHNFPVAVWSDIGELNLEGRKKAAEVFQLALEWDKIRTNWLPYQKQLSNFSDIASEWRMYTNGMPLIESWINGLGKEFNDAIIEMEQDPTKKTIKLVQSVLYSDVCRKLITTWKKIREIDANAKSVYSELINIPSKSDRVDEWWSNRPENAIVIDEKPETFPQNTDYQPRIDEVLKWIAASKDHYHAQRPKLEEQSEAERRYSFAQLRKAVELLPDTDEKHELVVEIENCEIELSEWPIDKINDVFSEYRPGRIEARIDLINEQIVNLSFKLAKTKWKERLNSDDHLFRSVLELEKAYRNNNGALEVEDYKHFRNSLHAVPIWITTAQSPQAIPMAPELFDVVIIDEASQCTMTNLLPLMYRGKSLAVIGDDKQLPAIPTIKDDEEGDIADKFKVTPFLQFIGHATTNVYQACVDTLPSRLADVVDLNEHYRSHPQIIGFSNRHIYQQRLQLNKLPKLGISKKLNPGVDFVHVSGQAERGENGRSWLNHPEAKVVAGQVKLLRQSIGRTYSIGVVTPCSAQKELIREELSDIVSDVLVDSAHGFQGDERDIMIFSPVASNGITSTSSRWIQQQNLVNVALTRAREYLLVVADINFCKRQEGILRDLANFLEEAKLVREQKSPAELKFYNMILMEGWNYEVQPLIGDSKVDFVLLSKSKQRIAVEIDGKKFHADRQEQDNVRDSYLKAEGYVVKRIPAREILETPQEVLTMMRELIHDIPEEG